MNRRSVLVALFAVLSVAALSPLAAFAQAHSHTAPNGGQIVQIGKFEAELVARPSEIAVYLTDEKEQKVDASGFSATAVVLAKGNERKTVKLLPAGDNRLTGKYDFAVDGKLRATLTLNNKAGQIGVGRYNSPVQK